MTKATGKPNDEVLFLTVSGFEPRHSVVIRHWDFDIPVKPRAIHCLTNRPPLVPSSEQDQAPRAT